MFLKYLRRVSSKSSRRAIVIIDNAKYHHANLHKEWRKQHTDRFALDFLPPYSPELNPIERLWKLTRRLCLHNRYFPSVKNMIVAVETQFAVWASGNETVRKLYATIKDAVYNLSMPLLFWTHGRGFSGQSGSIKNKGAESAPISMGG